MKPIPLVVLSLAGALGAAACTIAPRAAPERARYDLGTEAAPPSPAAAPLRVQVSMPAWLDNGEIAYRLLYDDPLRLHAYAASRWADRPGRLIAARLQERFAGAARCSVRIEIDEFAQHFARPERSEQILSVRWVVRAANGDALPEVDRRFSLATPSADASGGVAAAAQLVEQLAAALADDSGRLDACRTP